MKSLSSTLPKLIVSILCLTFLVNCEQPEESTDDGGSETVTFSGAYYSSCTAYVGATFASGTHTKKMIHFQPDGDFEYVTFFYSDAGCTSTVYGINQQGSYVVGPATTVPSGGYEIAFAISDLYLIWYTDAARTALSGGCGIGGLSGSSGVRTLGSAFGCMNIDVAAPNTIFYNVGVVGSSTAEIGIPDDDNPGVVNVGNINIGASLTFTK